MPGTNEATHHVNVHSFLTLHMGISAKQSEHSREYPYSSTKQSAMHPASIRHPPASPYVLEQ